AVPQRNGGQVLEELTLSLVEERRLLLLRGGGEALTEELVEVLVRVVGVVRAGAGHVERTEDVGLRREVELPSGAERGLDRAVVDLGAQPGEVRSEEHTSELQSR